MKSPNSVLGGFGTTVFEVMSRLANEHGAVNLGQGFPDGNGPDDVRSVAHEALDSSPNQYPQLPQTSCPLPLAPPPSSSSSPFFFPYSYSHSYAYSYS